MSGPGRDQLFAPFRRPAAAGLFTDFDGTLSAIAAEPDDAAPVAGAMAVLARLAGALDRVWVVSGRPVTFLERFVPAGIHLSGLYGLEASADGVRADHEAAGTWRAVVAAVADEAEESGPGGLLVERKGLSVTLHYRQRPDLADEAHAYATDAALAAGLVLHEARMSVELRPPIETDKGTVVHSAATGLDAVCFIGDDRGDLEAFDALDRLAADGMQAVRIAVTSAECPPELLARADLTVDGPAGVVEFLSWLADLRA